jgi:hypothetical protein
MTKRPSLAETMRQAVLTDAPAEAAAPAPRTRGARQALPPHPKERPAGYYAATRDGKKKVTAPLTPDAHKQLRQLSLDLDRTSEALLTEAINDLFRKYGRKPLA